MIFSPLIYIFIKNTASIGATIEASETHGAFFLLFLFRPHCTIFLLQLLALIR